jgi:hypothetical protein
MTDTLTHLLPDDMAGRWPQILPEHREAVAAVSAGYDLDRAVLRESSHYVYVLGNLSTEGGLIVKCANPENPEGDLAVEAKALELLNELPPGPVEIPKLVSYDPDSQVLTSTLLQGFPEQSCALGGWGTYASRERIGRQVAGYIAWLGAAVEPELCDERLGAVNHGLEWDFNVAKYLAPDKERYPTLARLGELASTKLALYYPDGMGSVREQVVQSDFRPDNAMFDWQSNLTGAYDFEFLTVEDAARMMRGFYSGDETVIKICIAEYESLTGQSVPLEQVATLAAIQAIMTLSYQLSEGITSFRWFASAQQRLMDQFPGEDWSELFTAVTEHFVPREGHWDSNIWDETYGKYQVSPDPRDVPRRVLTKREFFAVDQLANTVWLDSSAIAMQRKPILSS